MEQVSKPTQASRPSWYVIQCKGGESFRAAENLANQGYDVFHPVMNIPRKRNGKLITLSEPLFPYYLFIRLDQIVSNWRPLRSTRGVLRLITFGNMPIPVADALIDAIKTHPHQQKGIHDYFSPGDKVTITEGPFKELAAIFKHTKGEERAIVLLNMLQRPQAIEISVHQLKK
ncbi:transcription/translation regulatory transformer protein RfaH [Halomonas vilamensis]|uniref:Transcription/translation regulatory transformer protein RfaH n=1 Tax=Vreelandella vilamensis TaxID=531309 RepID=A0ABU1H5F0_9GAMM|nr:transcription/translation regulatory transformer protein RfaH [Halomonas vilamensis]MDR5899525.1 transcription/translation regulatory transformer protein RfaH [Halomonas vilamensis]